VDSRPAHMNVYKSVCAVRRALDPAAACGR
jgi:hypothetical protein